jgi:RimJ/RimL family protein N-acetyltransferase
MPLVVNEETRKPERTTPLDIPERIELGGLLLRRLREGDEPAIFERYASDPEVCRWLGIKQVLDVANIGGFVRRMQESWAAGTEYTFAMIDPEDEDDRLFGVISFRVEVTTVTFGYAIARSHWGLGHTTTALSALSDFVLTQPDIWRAQANCAVENPASARVMQKAGFTLEARLRRSVINPNISLEPTDALLYAKVRP